MSPRCSETPHRISWDRPLSFDTLTHLQLAKTPKIRQDWIASEHTYGVTGRVVASTHPEAWMQTLEVARDTHSRCLLGIHPWWATHYTTQARRSHLEWLAARRDVTGLGEIGLDYARAKTKQERTQQQTVLEEQLALAIEYSWPVLLHCVRAHSDLLHILRGFSKSTIRGVFHGWTGGPQYVAPAMDLGLYLSFGPAVLNGRRVKIQSAARLVPLDRLCIETDWPDAWHQVRHTPKSGYLRAIAGKVAALRGTQTSEVWTVCGINAKTLWDNSNG